MTDNTRPAIWASYRESLILALRLQDMPGDRIGEVVAEVQSHIADTGEDPTEAFGPPRVYAASLAEDLPRTPWWSTAITVAWSFAAGWLMANGLFAVLLGEQWLGQSGWLWLALGLVIGVLGELAVARRSTTVSDPRTGQDMVASNPWGLAAHVGLPILVVLLSVVAIRLFS